MKITNPFFLLVLLTLAAMVIARTMSGEPCRDGFAEVPTNSGYGTACAYDIEK